MTKPDTSDVEWWRGAVIYQIYPRSFADANNDGIGDLPGITAHLDYVASLGVDAIWLSPFFTSPMKDFGYDVADFCDVDPIFGTLKDFDALISRAQELGLKVIIDQVWSHTSDQHAWFQESRQDRTNPKADWYVWADPKSDGSPPNNWQAYFGGSSWQWDGYRHQYYLHNFLVSQPDLNLHNPDVQEAIYDTARFWLARGVDGFRMDVVNCYFHDPELRDNPSSGVPAIKASKPFDMQDRKRSEAGPGTIPFLEKLRTLLNTYGVRFTVAEVASREPLAELKAYTEGDQRLTSAYGFDFLYLKKFSPAAIAKPLSNWTGEPDEGWPSWPFSNHDAPRALSRWSPENETPERAKLFLMLLLSLRGNAFIYQGEELGLPQAHVPFEALQDPEAIANWPNTLGRDGARTPFPWASETPNAGFSCEPPWLPVDPRHMSLAVDTQDDDPASTLNFARSAIAARKASSALSLGLFEPVRVTDDTLVIIRSHSVQRVLCAYNFSEDQALSVRDLPTIKTVLLTLGTESGSPITELPPCSATWAEID